MAVSKNLQNNEKIIACITAFINKSKTKQANLSDIAQLHIEPKAESAKLHTLIPGKISVYITGCKEFKIIDKNYVILSGDVKAKPASIVGKSSNKDEKNSETIKEIKSPRKTKVKKSKERQSKVESDVKLSEDDIYDQVRTTVPPVTSQLRNLKPGKNKVSDAPFEDILLHANHSIFAPNSPSDQSQSALRVLLSQEQAKSLVQYAYLGQSEKHPVFLNTQIPFCILAMGVQGVGKSYSVATIIENCMINSPPHIMSNSPCSTVVFHFDQDESNFCEAITLSNKIGGLPDSISAIPRITILVSPSNYIQRKKFYEGIPNCTILPLLFNWSDLNAPQLKSLMRVDSDDQMPLYMSAILDMLRKFQKDDLLPSFSQFKSALTTKLKLTPAQNGPLDLRLKLLESLLSESKENEKLRITDLQEIFNTPNSLIIVDLTDPMISPMEANGIFKVVLAKFISTPLECGKLVVFDEAHKYLDSQGKDELSSLIVSATRQMRHHGLRLVISTQSPKSIPGEIIDLVSVALIHRFHAPDWFSYLKTKLPLKDEDFHKIINLTTGNALAFYGKWPHEFANEDEKQFFHEIAIRQRVTEDGGISKVSSKKLK
eukprot:NODE_343_length_10566_cov_0.542371.p1 type:complete len:601 gc:universal NODE_343_length_10566_cov_0.542371:7576-9378(+)